MAPCEEHLHPFYGTGSLWKASSSFCFAAAISKGHQGSISWHDTLCFPIIRRTRGGLQIQHGKITSRKLKRKICKKSTKFITRRRRIAQIFPPPSLIYGSCFFSAIYPTPPHHTAAAVGRKINVNSCGSSKQAHLVRQERPGPTCES